MVNVGTKIQPTYSTIVTVVNFRLALTLMRPKTKMSPLKKQFQKRWSHYGELWRKHANFCECKYVCI